MFVDIKYFTFDAFVHGTKSCAVFQFVFPREYRVDLLDSTAYVLVILSAAPVAAVN